jgi:acetyl esterase
MAPALGQGAAPEGGPVPLHPQVDVLLQQLATADGPAMETMSPVDARAVFARMAVLDPGEEVAAVEDRTIAGPAGELPIRIYTPVTPDGVAPTGVVLFLHGGGFVIGDLDTHDGTCRMLANRAGAVVVAVHYRLAPEAPAPAALDDAMAALGWVAEHAAELGATTDKLAVIGDSAGGNLAALVCQRARDLSGPAIAFQVLVYPCTDLTLGHPSIVENGEGYFLTRAGMEWFMGHYLTDLDPKDPIVSPLFIDSCVGLPPALVITAEFDPLRDEGEAYAERLRADGVPVEAIRYDGQIHAFFSMAAILDDARDAIDRAGAALAEALA